MSNESKLEQRIISIKKMTSMDALFHQSDDTENKQQQASRALERSNLHHEIADLKQQKEHMLQALRTSIQQEKEAWVTEKDAERKEAQDIGYQEGYQRGEQQAEEAWQGKLASINQLTDSAKEEYDRTIEKHEETIIELAIASAEKILHKEIEKNPTYTAIIKDAITALQNDAYIHMFVHPNTYQRVIEQKPEMEQIVGTKDLISIYTDTELSEHDCIIKHPNGQIDVSIDSQLRQIKNALFEKVMEES